MVIIITGASHTGKTKLASCLMKKYQYPYLSIDHLKMGLIRTKMIKSTVYDDDLLTEELWPIVSEMIKTVIENEQNLIVEGCYVPSNWKSYFDKTYLDEIKFICLFMTRKYIDDHFYDITSHSNDIEKRLSSSISKDELIRENELYFEKFKDNPLIINNDYEGDIKRWLGDNNYA